MSVEDHLNKLRDTFQNMNEEDMDRLMENLNERAASVDMEPNQFQSIVQEAASTSMWIRNHDPEVFEAALRHVQEMGETVGVQHMETSFSQGQVEEINDILVDAAERIHEVMEDED